MRRFIYQAGGVFVILAALFTSAAQASTVIESYAVRDWNVGAYANERTKEFSHCAMQAQYKNGITLIFSIGANGEWWMNLANDNWSLIEGDKYRFDVDLDGRQGRRWVGTAISPTVLNVPLADEKSLLELFSASYRLTITTANEAFRFNLDNSRAGLDAVVDCARRHIAFRSNNPFSRAARKPSGGGSDEAFYSEGAIVMTNMLSSIGVSGQQLLPVKDLREKYEGLHAVWFAGGAAGALRIAADARSVSDVGTEILASAAQACAGKFASGRKTEGGALSIAAICEEKDGKFSNANYIVLKRESGGAYLFSVFALEQTENSAKEATRYGDLIMAAAQK
jgi:hypothetical protein